MMLLIQSNYLTAQNGYRLEFEDVVTLSVDTVPNVTIPGNATWTESYTVPANMVLKINSGMLRNSPSGVGIGSLFQLAYLDIDGNVIGTYLSGYSSTSFADNKFEPYLQFSNDNALWVSAGKTIRLTFKNGGNAALYYANGWVSGVLFRKISN